jgi:transcriptional regulator with XRE-family HTH domain
MELKELGKSVAILRKEKKVSQEKLSKEVKISRATISGFENGTCTDIGYKKVLQIIDYLGYELSLKEKSPFPVFEDIVNG